MPKPTAKQQAKLPPALLKAIAKGKSGAVTSKSSKGATKKK